jgi:hypothetical protein
VDEPAPQRGKDHETPNTPTPSTPSPARRSLRLAIVVAPVGPAGTGSSTMRRHSPPAHGCTDWYDTPLGGCSPGPLSGARSSSRRPAATRVTQSMTIRIDEQIRLQRVVRGSSADTAHRRHIARGLGASRGARELAVGQSRGLCSKNPAGGSRTRQLGMPRLRRVRAGPLRCRRCCGREALEMAVTAENALCARSRKTPQTRSSKFPRPHGPCRVAEP